MSRANNLTIKDRQAILEAYGRLSSMRKVAMETGFSLGTVWNVIKHPAKSPGQKRLGRPRKVSERDLRQVLRVASTGQESARKIQKRLQLQCSVRTIQRCLKDSPFLSYKKRTIAPKLSKRHQNARYEWADKEEYKSADYWHNIVFSDEKKWNLDGPDGLKKHWCDSRSPTVASVRRHSGGGSVMIWGAFSGIKKSSLKFLSGTQDSFRYCRTLETNLLPFIDNANQIFQQDNAYLPCDQGVVNRSGPRFLPI